MRHVQDRRPRSQDVGSHHQRSNQPQYPSQQGQAAQAAANQETQAWWHQQEQDTQHQSTGVQEQRSSGQQLGSQGLPGQQAGSRQPPGQASGQAQQAPPKRKMAPVPQPKAPREISLPQDVTARQLASLLGNPTSTSAAPAPPRQRDPVLCSPVLPPGSLAPCILMLLLLICVPAS